MQEEKSRVIALVGPTAVGKTGLALQLAKELGAEIVNADSVQVYRYLDIGTAKPTAAERAMVPHHLLDIVEPDQDFDAWRYSRLGRKTVRDLGRRGLPAVVVGGTGLYVKALLYGLFPGPAADRQLRRHLRQQAEKDGGRGLYQRLAEIDPDCARRLHPHDLFRIIRALEVWQRTGRPVSELRRQHGFQERPFAALKIGLDLQRQQLAERIDRRVEAMMDRGFLQEVRELLERGYGPELRSMQSLGYRHLLQHLLRQVPLAEVLRLMKRDTRRYAKRQMTWFRQDREIRWFGPEQAKKVIEVARQFILQADSC